MANFALLGISLIGLAAALYRSVRPGRPAKVAPVLLGIAGIGFLMSVFPTDTGPPNAPATWHGDIHAIGFIVAFLPLELSMFFLAFTARGDSRWKGYGWIGPVVGVIALLAFFGLAAIMPASVDQIPFYITLVVLFAGISLIGFRLRKSLR
jgi:hypothetical protein